MGKTSGTALPQFVKQRAAGLIHPFKHNHFTGHHVHTVAQQTLNAHNALHAVAR